MTRSRAHRARSAVRRGVIAGAALLALGGCGAVQWPGASPEPEASTSTPASPTADVASDADTPDTPEVFALAFVAQTAAPCSQVWVRGADLPGDYEWCADAAGDPVAGVRAGSCEVVVYGNNMWAIPSHEIHVTEEEVSLDPGYVEALTSCKRRAVAANRR